MIRLDASARSVVAVCDCGWRCIRPDRLTADAAALDHVQRGHAGDRAARNAVDKRNERRSAAVSGCSDE